jgi:hypothetical protein
MNIKQLRHIIKFWLWSAMHSQYFLDFEIRFNGLIQVKSNYYNPEFHEHFASIHLYIMRPSIQIYVDWRAKNEFTDCFPQYKNADWLSLTAPF